MRIQSLILCSFILCTVAGLSDADPQADVSTTDLKSFSGAVRKAHRQLIERSEDKICDVLSLKCLGNGVEDLRQLLKDYTESALNSRNGDVKSLIADLRKVDDTAFAETLKKEEGSTLKEDWDTDPPFVIRRQLPLGDIVITLNRFSLGALALPSDVVIIQAFRKEGTGYVFADETGDELFGILRYREFETLIPSPSVSQLWLLVQGQVSGYMGDLERARLYSFDGYKFNSEWAPEDRINMTVKVTGNDIDARYISKTIHQVGADTRNCMEEKMQVEPGTLLRFGTLNHGECEDAESAH